MKAVQLLTSRVLMAAAMTMALAAATSCGGEEEPPPAEKLKVGIIYITTPGDVGWTYAHHLGIKDAEAALTDVEITYKEGIDDGMATGDTSAFDAALEDLVAKGNKLIFTTSFGYMDPTLAMAKKYPEVKFEHCSGYKTHTNMGNYFGRIYQARYLSGMVAGLTVAQGDKIGYVAAFPIPEVIRGLNAFTLGVRKVNPTATVEVMWTKTWYDPKVEGDTAKALLAKGAKLLAQHQDSTATIMAAKEAGALAIGYDSDMVGFAPDTVLTGPVFKWGVYYKKRIQSVKDGTWKSESYWGSIAEGVVDLGPYGSKVTQDTKDKVAAAKAELVNGTYDVFWGPIKKQDGTTLLVDQGGKLTDAQMLSMTDLVEGVVGTVPQ